MNESGSVVSWLALQSIKVGLSGKNWVCNKLMLVGYILVGSIVSKSWSVDRCVLAGSLVK